MKYRSILELKNKIIELKKYDNVIVFTNGCFDMSINFGLAQDENGQKTFPNGVNIPENRLPELLRDVKVLLTDAFIADVMSDTLEVVYNLNRIFDLLSEADQYGEMDAEDKD